jgi:hypothetical protein
LEEQKNALRKYLDDNYPAASSTSHQPTTASGANNGAGKQQIINFAALDQGRMRTKRMTNFCDTLMPHALLQTVPILSIGGMPGRGNFPACIGWHAISCLFPVGFRFLSIAHRGSPFFQDLQ